MEAISNHRSSNCRLSKQDDFSKDEGDTVITSVPTATSHKRSITTESPVANAESCSKGDVMSSEMADPGSPPLVPTTLHVPTNFKTQALHAPLLVHLPHCSTSCAEQCKVAFHRQLHYVPLKIERPVRVQLRVPDVTAPLAVPFQHSSQPAHCPSQILQRTEACTAVRMRAHYLPPASSEQLPPSLPQIVAPAHSPNISVPSPVQLQQSPLASSVACKGMQDTPRPRLGARSYWVKISFAQVFLRVPQVCVDLVAQPPHAQDLVGHSYDIAECASTRRSQTTHVHTQFPLPQFIMFFLRTFPQSAAFVRGFRSTNPMQ